MNPWIAKTIVLLGSIVMVVIRAPHGQRSRTVKVVKSRKGALENVLLTFAWIGFFLPLVWVATNALAFADYPSRPAPLILGTLCIALGLGLFQRSHADLGTNWSITLEVRENHRLVTQGVYRRIRHPMYSALLLDSLGQALVLPNWIVGPSYAVVMTILFAFRVHREEEMMLEQFPGDYAEYARRTKRLVPGIW